MSTPVTAVQRSATAPPGRDERVGVWGPFRGPRFRWWRGVLAICHSTTATVGVAIVLAWVVLAGLAPLLAPYAPNATDLAALAHTTPSRAHWLGTDHLGRDILSRILWGARPVLVIAPLAVLGATALGSLLGLAAGYKRGWLDLLVSNYIEWSPKNNIWCGEHRPGFRAYCAAGLNARGRPVGVLELFHRSALEPDDEWLSFLDAIAGFTGVAVDNAAMSEALRHTMPSTPLAGAPKLSNLERQILGLVVEGTTNAAIAKALHLSQSTVKFHVRQILQKVGAGNRTELARLATREGWM